MKEYKVLAPNLGFRKRAEKLQDFINNYAIESWTLKAITNNRHGGIAFLVFEREKNR